MFHVFLGSMVCVNGALYVLGGSKYPYGASPEDTVEKDLHTSG